MRHPFSSIYPLRALLISSGLAIFALVGGAQTPPAQPPADPLAGAGESPFFAAPEAAPTPTPPLPSPAPTASSPAASTAAADGDEGPSILRLVLDEKSAVTVVVSSSRTTTIVFPLKIDDVQGSGFTPDPAQLDGDYMVSVRSSYISLTALRPAPGRRNLNVVANGRVYPIDVVPASLGAAAPFVVYLNYREAPSARPALAGPDGSAPGSAPAPGPSDRPAAPVAGVGPMKKSAARPAPALKPSGAARLIGVLDALKTLTGLETQEAAQKAAALMGDATFLMREKPESNDLLDFQVTVTHVMRRNQLDAVAFALRIKNTCSRPIYLDLESGAVRVGDPTRGMLLRAATSDVPTVIQPGEELPAYIVCVGTPSGAPNWVDPSNRFFVSFALRETARPGKTASTPRR